MCCAACFLCWIGLLWLRHVCAAPHRPSTPGPAHVTVSMLHDPATAPQWHHMQAQERLPDSGGLRCAATREHRQVHPLPLCAHHSHMLDSSDAVVMHGSITAPHTWRRLSSCEGFVGSGRSKHSAVALKDGIIVFGGDDGRRMLNDLIRFDTLEHSWSRCDPEGCLPHVLMLCRTQGGHEGIAALAALPPLGRDARH
jgi:hypothetical protein